VVNGALGIGGFVGVLLSGAYVYWEIGRYASPQVPQTLFDERKEVFAYTAGLFVGIALAFVYLLYLSAIDNGALISGVVDVVLLAGATEIVQYMLVRSHYFGATESTPFYALGFRAAIGGVLALAAVTASLGSGILNAGSIALVACQAVALVTIEVTGGLQSIAKSGVTKTAGGGPVAGLLVGVAAFAVLGLGDALGTIAGIAAALLVIGGLVPPYRRLRRRILGAIDAAENPIPSGTVPGRPFGRRGP
jgi:hypothetical protein